MVGSSGEVLRLKSCEFQLFFSFFKSLVGKDVVVELKNDLRYAQVLQSWAKLRKLEKLSGKDWPTGSVVISVKLLVVADAF